MAFLLLYYGKSECYILNSQLLIITQFSIRKKKKNQSINNYWRWGCVWSWYLMCHAQETSLSQVGRPHMCKTYLLVRDRSHAPDRWKIFLVCVISHFDSWNHLLQISNNAIHCTMYSCMALDWAVWCKRRQALTKRSWLYSFLSCAELLLIYVYNLS